MEAGLPSWARLVRALLESVAPATSGESDRAAWLDAAAEAGLLGMAATARALAGSDEEFVKRVDRFLYRGKGPEQFDPGPLAREIAAWKRDYPEIRLATFNYDQLLERALEDVGIDAQARQDNDPEEDGVAAVRHLHGRLTGTPDSDAVILTERDYATWPAGTWQDAFMRDALEGVCVFLGLSFTDQNLLRWIYGSTGTEHVAVLSRQSAPRLSAAVRRELESATRARLRLANVTAYWADFYAELAQLMHEARRRRGPGRPPADYQQRAQKRALRARRRCLPATGFEARQRKVREILAASLSGVRAALHSIGANPTAAVLGLGLWGLDYDRREVTLWASSDRIHVDLSTVAGVALAWGSEWVAVEAITQGSVVEWDPETYASRWRAVRGIPLVWTRPEQRERIRRCCDADHDTAVRQLDLRRGRAARARHPEDDRHRTPRPARQALGLRIRPPPPRRLRDVTSPLDNTNPHGIRVVADRAPLRLDAQAAFAKGSHKATAGIQSLTQPRRRNSTAATAKRGK